MCKDKKAVGDPFVSHPVQGTFRSLTISPKEHDLAADLVPGYSELRRELALQEVEMLVYLRAVCPLTLEDGTLDMDARISQLTSDPH